LAGVPGVSAHLCGSAVVYQPETKAEWLGISAALLANPGPVSREVAIEMAAGALARTPRADVAASVTGHLGPDAPAAQDGLVYIAAAVRNRSGSKGRPWTIVKEVRLKNEGSRTASPAQLRIRRQATAALRCLELVTSVIAGRPR
jgi:nicotinamide mononucleotide (NMN) deamidase PncC